MVATTTQNDLANRARAVIPGGVNSGNRQLPWPLVVGQAEGAYFTDIDGNRFLDYHAAFGPLVLGHNHPVVNEAVRAATANVDLMGAGVTPYEIELAETLNGLIPSAERVLLTNSGSEATFAALSPGRTIALANKESLVSAGDVMKAAIDGHKATLLPVDSEHNAIFQCLDARLSHRARRIILTASGGPFRDRPLAEMAAITPSQAVAHPNWSMGAKISVDSATMMNKGLELIEAFHLFPLGHEQIEIVVHRQSVVHSMVEYVDGSTLAQLGTPDMRTPIAYALAWPDRMATPGEPLDLVRIGRLDFEAPDPVRFPALALARAAVEAGGARPAILNAANEVAVAAFLGGAVGFLEIAAIVADTLERFDPPAPQTLDAVLDIDREARRLAAERVEERVA